MRGEPCPKTCSKLAASHPRAKSGEMWSSPQCLRFPQLTEPEQNPLRIWKRLRPRAHIEHAAIVMTRTDPLCRVRLELAGLAEAPQVSRYDRLDGVRNDAGPFE